MVISASQSRESSTGTVTERRFALGLGLTNECNLACSFCYRDPTRLDRLSLEQVRAVMKSLPVRSVNLGTGENGMPGDTARDGAAVRLLARRRSAARSAARARSRHHRYRSVYGSARRAIALRELQLCFFLRRGM